MPTTIITDTFEFTWVAGRYCHASATVLTEEDCGNYPAELLIQANRSGDGEWLWVCTELTKATIGLGGGLYQTDCLVPLGTRGREYWTDDIRDEFERLYTDREEARREQIAGMP